VVGVVAPLQSEVIALWSRIRSRRMIAWLTVRERDWMNITDRLHAHGGTLAIHSTPGEGTPLTGQLPVAQAAEPVG